MQDRIEVLSVFFVACAVMIVDVHIDRVQADAPRQRTQVADAQRASVLAEIREVFLVHPREDQQIRTRGCGKAEQQATTVRGRGVLDGQIGGGGVRQPLLCGGPIFLITHAFTHTPNV